MFSIQEKKKKEDCIFQENIGLHVFFIHNYKTTFNAVRQKNGTCNMTDFVFSHLGLVYQSFLGPKSTVHSCLCGLFAAYPLTLNGSKEKKPMPEFNLVTAKLRSHYLDQTFLFFITDIASPFLTCLSHSHLRDKTVDNINTHRKKIPAVNFLIYLKGSMCV